MLLRLTQPPPSSSLQSLLNRHSDALSPGITPQPFDPTLSSPTDFLYAASPDSPFPQDIFPLLRWGGQFLYLASNPRQAGEMAQEFSRHGFDIEIPPTASPDRRSFFREIFSPGARPTHLIARKTHLLPPGQNTDRFTYDVHLQRRSPAGHEYVVCKKVPTLESVIARLRRRWTEASDALIEKRARKFTQTIFPTFLTREAAMLKILQRDLPEEYKCRVPHLLDMQQDERGFVHTLHMNLLPSATAPLSHLDFAQQSADLLSALHDRAHVIHLDLRLDNFVITPQGVGFVDFGSSVRVGEDLSRNPLLGTLFDDLLRTSQIQHMLEKLTLAGHVTSQIIQSAHRKVDKAADFFYLAVQFNAPHSNPDLKPLIQFDPQSPQALGLADLTNQILKPSSANDPPFKSAHDIARGIDRLRQTIETRSR